MNEYEIEGAILNHEFRVKHTWEDWYWREVPKDVEIPMVGIVNFVETGGGSTDGADRYVVIRIDQPDGVTRYFKKVGNSGSFSLEMYGEFKEVFPKERIVKEFI